MTDSNPDVYRAALRTFMAERGRPVSRRESYYNDWADYDMLIHARPPADQPNGVHHGEGCSWVVPEGSFLRETSLVEWGGTFGTDSTAMCVEVTGAHCACGKHRDVTLRFVGSFGDVLLGALGADTKGIPL